jgi:hypothetical protein
LNSEFERVITGPIVYVHIHDIRANPLIGLCARIIGEGLLLYASPNRLHFFDILEDVGGIVAGRRKIDGTAGPNPTPPENGQRLSLFERH